MKRTPVISERTFFLYMAVFAVVVAGVGFGFGFLVFASVYWASGVAVASPLLATIGGLLKWRELRGTFPPR